MVAQDCVDESQMPMQFVADGFHLFAGEAKQGAVPNRTGADDEPCAFAHRLSRVLTQEILGRRLQRSSR